jgi:hypothetical protein
MIMENDDDRLILISAFRSALGTELLCERSNMNNLIQRLYNYNLTAYPCQSYTVLMSEAADALEHLISSLEDAILNLLGQFSIFIDAAQLRHDLKQTTNASSFLESATIDLN